MRHNTCFTQAGLINPLSVNPLSASDTQCIIMHVNNPVSASEAQCIIMHVFIGNLNVIGSLNVHFDILAPAVTVGERRELWILPPFFFWPLLLPITL